MIHINVVHIVEDLKIGGLENIISSLVTGMAGERFHFAVWCLSAGGEVYDCLRKRGVDVRIMGMEAKPSYRFIRQMATLLKKENIDIVHCHGYSATTVGRIAAFMAKTPVILAHVHSTYWEFSIKQRVVEWSLGLFTDCVVCCSKTVADFVNRREGISKQKIRVIYNGVDISRFAISRGRKSMPKIIIGCIASLVPNKGHQYLLEAVMQARKQLGNGVITRLAGDGPLRTELEQFSRKLGITENIEFLGSVEDIPSFLSLCDIVVLPSSEREGLGIALLEAMSAGVPVIGTRIGGIPEVIEEGVNGIIVPPSDSMGLANAIITLSKDHELRNKMGEKGREIARAKFSLSSMCQAMGTLYHELYARK